VAAITLGELLVASVVFRKNFVSEARYHFVYYPAIVALFAWILAELPARAAASWRRALAEPPAWTALSLILLVGFGNAVATDIGLEFPKRTKPDRTGAALAAAAAAPVLVVTGSGSFHETVLQLSYLLELLKQSPAAAETEFAVVTRSNEYTGNNRDAPRQPPSIFWTGFAHVRDISRPPATLWVNAGQLQTSEYPPRLEVRARERERRSCTVDQLERARRRDDDDYLLYHCSP
jgi:hypothetical protein